MSDCLLEAKSVTKHYDDGRIQALRGVDLEINAGEFVAFTGPSGSGKSTLLHLLGGLDQPTSGQVLFRGQVLADGFDLDSYRSQRVGFIFQAFHLLPTLRALENVQVPMFETNLSRHEREDKARVLLCEMGLEHRLHQYPTELSAGERQRVAIARSLANDPEILLADEPTGNLDSRTGSEILDLLHVSNEQFGMTVVMVTHEQALAERYAERLIFLADGKVVADHPNVPTSRKTAAQVPASHKPGEKETT
jgi:putative ABC transport system ATP-binding protein